MQFAFANQKLVELPQKFNIFPSLVANFTPLLTYR